MNKPIVPCKGCEEREVGCHGICEKYKLFQKENAAYTKEAKEERERFLRFPPTIRAMENAYREINRRKR